MRKHMKSISAKSILVALLLWILLSLLACVIIPLPGGEDKISEDDISAIIPDLSTRDDVLRKFGKPDFSFGIIGKPGHDFVYRWERFRGILIYGSEFHLDIKNINSDELLHILFDKADQVKRIQKSTRAPFEPYGEFWSRCLDQLEDNGAAK